MVTLIQSDYGFIMDKHDYSEFIDLDGIFNQAVKETEEILEHGFDLTEPCLVTSLGWYANKYPEIADRCNDALMALIDKQYIMYPELRNAHYEIDLDSF